jgi:hypothetical protein
MLVDIFERVLLSVEVDPSEQEGGYCEQEEAYYRLGDRGNDPFDIEQRPQDKD